MISPGQWLENLLTGLTAASTTDIFIAIILGVLVLSFLEARRGTHSRFLNYAPSVLTSIGILGTFVGIVIGLLQFDTANIDQSIPPLLAGLKTAFITSLVGMASSIVFKACDVWLFARRREEGPKESVTPGDIHDVLSRQAASIESMKQALVGDEEGTLLGQIRLLRGDASDHARRAEQRQEEFARKLWEELANFAEMLSKSATEQVIEALSQVIRDFNDNLTEQFGENFKALDASVKKLVDWQEQYKGQVEVMAAQYEQSVASLVETRQAVGGIWEECKSIPVAMNDLQQVMQVNQHQIEELNRHLEAFELMRDKAIEAVPQLQAQLEHIGDELRSELEKVGAGMNEGTAEMKRMLLEGATEFGESVRGTNAAMTDLATSITNEAEGISRTLDDTARQLSSTSRDMLERLEFGAKFLQTELERSVTEVLAGVRDNVERAMGGVKEQVEQAVARTGEGVNHQVAMIDEALQKEINRAMEEMGRALTTVTGRFAKDYTHLVEAMGRVVAQRPQQPHGHA